MRIAIVSDWLVTYAGAEHVIEQMFRVFPEADLYSVIDFIDKGKRAFLLDKTAKTTFIQKLPQARKKYRRYLPLMPLAIEQLDLSGYDVVISSSYAVAKGILLGPDQLHISYVHSPIRYAWDLQNQYLEEAGLTRGVKSWLARAILHYIRLWDVRTANSVDYFMANSCFIARRIWKAYHRTATVIYPPVETDAFSMCEKKQDFYVTASRLVPYKKIDLIVEAFSQMPDKKLFVIGDGPDYKKIRNKAGKNVEMLGYQPFEALKEYLQSARAFVFAAEEDFGIAPVEAQACGTPVIAFGKGGVTETIIGLRQANPTGVFFQEQTIDSLKQAVDMFERNCENIKPAVCRCNAQRFDSKIFRSRFRDFSRAKINEFFQEMKHKGTDSKRE